MVGSDGRKYALRLHTPAPDRAITHRADWIESEIAFIEALSLDGRVNVQRPVRTLGGACIAHATSDSVWATMLGWIPGSIFDQMTDRAPHAAHAVGTMIAHMHNFVLSWPESASLPRPSYNGERIRTAASALADGVGMGLFSSDALKILVEGARAVGDALDIANVARNRHGLIHADPGLGNLIVNGDAVSIIDFGLCGHGPLMFDLGGLMGSLDQRALRNAALDGYASLRPLTSQDHRDIEAGFIGGIYLFMAMHLRNRHVAEWFGRRLSHVIKDYVEPFIARQPFLQPLLL